MKKNAAWIRMFFFCETVGTTWCTEFAELDHYTMVSIAWLKTPVFHDILIKI